MCVCVCVCVCVCTHTRVYILLTRAETNPDFVDSESKPGS